jgi:ABC-2 type transport system permease protein
VKLIRDSWLLFMRELMQTLRNPVWLIIGLFQPICFLLLFAPLLDGIAQAPGFPPGGALNVFTPGLLVMMGMYGAAFVGFGLIADLRAGVIERLRVTPVSRLALLLGRAVRDVLVLVVQSLLLILAAWPMGLRINVGGIAVAFGLIALIGLILASCSYALALAFKSEDALAPTINFFLVPLQLLSGITLPLTLAPLWIRNIAAFNPLSYAVDAARALFNGALADGSVMRGFAVLALLALLATWWAAQSFRQATA